MTRSRHSGRRSRRNAVGDVMRSRWIAIRPSDSLYEAYIIMCQARLRHLLVVEDGALVGILTYRDLLEQALTHVRDVGEVLRLDEDLRREPVRSAMQADPHTIDAREPLREAVRRMDRLGLGCLPVVESASGEARLIGLVTESDLLRAAYEPAAKRLATAARSRARTGARRSRARPRAGA